MGGRDREGGVRARLIYRAQKICYMTSVKQRKNNRNIKNERMANQHRVIAHNSGVKHGNSSSGGEMNWAAKSGRSVWRSRSWRETYRCRKTT